MRYGIRLECEGCVLNLELKRQAKPMALHMQGVWDSSPVVLKQGLILSSQHAGKKSTLDLPERHHMAWRGSFLSRRKSFGEHSAAAAGNRA